MAIEEIKDVQILCQKDATVLRQQNAEFLAQYPTDDAQIDYYTDLAMKLWDEFEIDGSYEIHGTRKNVQTWFANKSKQMELFRKHPYWCEEAKAIIFAREEKRHCNYGVAQNMLGDLICYIRNHKGQYCAGDDILYAIYQTIGYIQDESACTTGVVNRRFIDRFENYNSKTLPDGVRRMLKEGTKLTRFVRKCCEEYRVADGTTDVTKLEDEHEPDDRTYKSFEKYYAKFADALSDLTVRKMTVVSLNFLDFMTMSNGNSWSTCHFINSHGIFHGGDTSSSYHGQYKQGCLSYALDEPSFILYTLPTDYAGSDYYRCQKLTRMCCQYQGGILVTGKCYPNNEDALIAQYRQTLQTIIAELEGIPNMWTFSKNVSRIQSFCTTAEGANHYADYFKSSQKPTISLSSRLSIDIDSPMNIGHKAYCLHCGSSLEYSSSQWMQCDSHRQKMVCKKCGKKLVDGAYHTIGGNLYCTDCTFHCGVHNRVELRENMYGTITTKNGDVQVCAEAMELFAKCEDCGIYELKEKMLRTHNGYVCKKHSRKYQRCSFCGLYVLNKDARTNQQGNIMCENCEKLCGDKRFALVEKSEYAVGDYVVMADKDAIRRCSHDYNDHMLRYYPNRIVKIRDVLCSGDVIRVSTLGGESWSWDNNCIRCAIFGVDDAFIGKTLEQIGRQGKGK